MDKATFDEIKARYGGKINSIYFDNTRVLHLGYGNPANRGTSGAADPYLDITDIETETIGTTDFLVVKRIVPNHAKVTQMVKSINLIPLDTIQSISICDEEKIGDLEVFDGFTNAKKQFPIYPRLDPKTIQ